jgi:transposase
LTIVETRAETRAITGGVDTHAGVHVAAALDPVGGLLGVREFPATTAGYARLLGWLGGFGTVALAGIEGTGSYGAGLARHITAAGIRVVEVDRSDRQDRRRQGKSDPLDAVSAARAAQSGRARGAPKGRDGAVEAIRALMVAKRSAAGERTRTINQARALILTGPDDLRTRFAKHTPAALVAGIASLRPRPGDVAGHATRVALRERGRRAVFLDGQLERPGELIVPLVTARAPGLLALYGIGPNTAALLLIAAGDHPGAAALRGRLGTPVRGRPHPGIIGEGHPPPAQPRRRPAGQPCPVADRVHPPGLPPRHPRLRRTPHQRRKVQGRDHPLPEAVRRPPGLPAPAP